MISRKGGYNSPVVFLSLALFLLHFQVMNAAPMQITGDEQSCQAKLDQAEESYYNGEPDLSISLVSQCLENTSLSKDAIVRAHKILARCHLVKEDTTGAKKQIRLLLQVNPAYHPTIEEESPRFVSLVAEMKEEQAKMAATQEKTGIIPWIWIGAGSVAAAAIIIVASGSGGEENTGTNNPLPAPPVLP